MMTDNPPPRDCQPPDIVRAHVFISGHVQGIGYRYSTWDTAALLKLKGWVRNLRDGRVEAVFEGSGDRVQDILQWCHQGPPHAEVTEVAISYEPPEYLQRFDVI